MENRLKEIIKSKKITQDKLAEILGVTRQTINNWVNNRSQPNPKQWAKISEALKIKEEQIFFGISVFTNDNNNNEQ